ncbi:putative Ferritin [Thiomonas arsenitoxydans]|uniref:Ferritin n=2 Tax=Thiomonas arsenitoxydans (strain DSM 22701 / CIP 110005 / 3As) TaxID=426114 RepID=A0ABM9T631_THIA3|nr:putative Ferritin [Thiomonas arsenitoxydans]CQR40590.1 putative Ferritin [Thiomonas arsenitoxydans]
MIPSITDFEPMKTPTYFSKAILALGGALMVTAAFAGNGRSGGDSTRTLDNTEAASIVFMREEEKLARDVYQLLYTQWGWPIFNNIAASEQQHMDAVGTLITRYKLPDPASHTGTGVFVDPELQTLFNALMSHGQTSLNAALQVGAAIEDLDIKDLNERIAQTDNPDVKLVYMNLLKGSRNHLRSFVSQLTAAGVSYTPQYITQAEFDAIINSPKETGRV